MKLLKILEKFVAGSRLRCLHYSITLVLCLSANLADGAEADVYQCPPKKQKTSKLKPQDVYRGMPFRAGEEAVYDVSYLGMGVGSGTIKVLPAELHQGEYLRSFVGVAKTADWYRYTYVVHDEVSALVSPEDFSIEKFYLKQKEGTLFGGTLEQEKWLDFDHENCKVTEKTKKEGEQVKAETFELHRGAYDAFGVIFSLRSLRYTAVDQVERILVYSSEKNWWLEAKAVKFEWLNVGAGKFKAVKLKLQTYIGKDLQQKGDVHVWVSIDHPNRPMLKIEADIKIGSIDMELTEFKPGGAIK